MTITKSHIIERLQYNCGYTKNKSKELAEAFFDTVKKALESGEDILISGFGKFNVVNKHARKGRNPATGNYLALGARRIVSFRCSSSLRKKINGNV